MIIKPKEQQVNKLWEQVVVAACIHSSNKMNDKKSHTVAWEQFQE
jgi:hypothetical protein